MNEQTIQSMKELIAKQTICTDAVVDKFNELAKKWEAKGGSATKFPKTAKDRCVRKLPKNCNDISLLQEHIEDLNEKLFNICELCIQRELDAYALIDGNWGTAEGRKKWYYMEWTKCGIPDFVYEQLGKYPSYTYLNDDGTSENISIKPRGDWDWEKKWEEYEEREAARLKQKEEHDRWYNSLTPYEQEEYDREQNKRMQEFFENQQRENKLKNLKRK